MQEKKLFMQSTKVMIWKCKNTTEKQTPVSVIY